MGAGVLPISFHKGKIYFLFSREWINSKEDGGLWSDFGGSKDNNESFKETAIRECKEESNKILGSTKRIKYLVDNAIKSITFDNKERMTRNLATRFIYLMKNICGIDVDSGGGYDSKETLRTNYSDHYIFWGI